MSTPGQTLGRAGKGLETASWAANEDVRKIGHKAELQTGAELHKFAIHGATILNDLQIPIPGFKANIDHIVVSGNNVLILDSKAWADGIYWTMGGHTRRGLKHFKHADSGGIPASKQGIKNYLLRHGIKANIIKPLIVVWSKGNPNFWFYKPKGAAKVVTGQNLYSHLRRKKLTQPANPQIVAALHQLLN